MIVGDLEEQLVGAAALDRADEPIGEVRSVYLDERTERAGWARVRVPLLGSEVLVPLEDAAWDHDALRLAVPGAAVLAAPVVHGSEGPTGPELERLRFHYGIPCVRRPREAAAVFEVASHEVSYSVRDSAA